jgi:putative iron-dependent peroxidase
MTDVQSGILGPVPPQARYLTFSLEPGADARTALQVLAEEIDTERTVVGLGRSLVLALDREIEGLRLFPRHTAAGIEIPSTPVALWCWLKGEDRGELVHRTRSIQRALATAFRGDPAIDAFRYGAGLDLTGYEDGTENPEGDRAAEVAVLQGRGEGLDGSSFVAVQKWIHDLDRFEAMSPEERDHTIGRRKADNEELDDAPPSAHVKRTAQESFEPEAFVLRRSMPWTDETRSGLVFVAFGATFDPFEALLQRMVGADDGISDALFSFTHPVTGSYFWCPPATRGRLDLRAIGL